MPILKKLKLKRKTLKVGCFNNPFLILIGILLIAVIIVILYHYFYKKSNTIERFYQTERRTDGEGEEKQQPTVLEDETASDTNCQPDIRGKEWKKRKKYIKELEDSGELELISDCCEFNNDKETNDAFKGYNMHCEAAFAMKLDKCLKKGTGKDDEGNCPIKSGKYDLVYKTTNVDDDDGNAWRYQPNGYLQ